jgi:hypothetical protein
MTHTPVTKPVQTVTDKESPAAVEDSPISNSESAKSIVDLKGVSDIHQPPLIAKVNKQAAAKEDDKPKDALAMMAAVAMAELMGKSPSEPITEVSDDSTHESDSELKETSEVAETTQKRKAADQDIVAVSPETTTEQHDQKRPRASPSESPIRQMEARHASPVSMMSTTSHHHPFPPRGSPVHSFMRHDLPMPYHHPGFRPSVVYSHHSFAGRHPSSRSSPPYDQYVSPPHHAPPPSYQMTSHMPGPVPMPFVNCYEHAVKTSGLPKSLSFRKICSKCGKVRGEHGELGFGNKCVFEECGKCGAGVEAHEKVGCPMGILCTLTVEQGAVPGAVASYERKIRDLAARAELQKNIVEENKKRAEKLAQMAQATA